MNYRKEVKYRLSSNIELFLINSKPKLELPSKLLEQVAFNEGPTIEEHIVLVTDKSTHEEHFCKPSKTNKKHFKKGITLLTGYNGIFSVTNKNNRFYFVTSNADEYVFIQIVISPAA